MLVIGLTECTVYRYIGHAETNIPQQNYMSKKQSTQPSPGILETSGLAANKIREWNDLQRKFSREGFTVIEFVPTAAEGKYWRCYLGKDEKKSKLDFKIWKTKDISLETNEEIRRCFSEPGFKTSASFWNRLKSDLNLRGFFIPVDELSNLEISRLETYFSLLKLKQEYFPFVSFLNDLKKESLEIGKRDIPLAILALWHFFRFYVDFLIKASSKQISVFRRAKDLFTEHTAIAGFDHKLPSEQVITILFLLCDQFYLQEKNKSVLKKLINRSAPNVQAFFEKHTKKILAFIESGFKTILDKKRLNVEKEIKGEFFNICLGDANLIRLQEFLDDDSQSDFMQYLPQELQNNYGLDRKKTISDKMKAVIGTASIMDRIQAVADNVQSNAQPLFVPTPNSFADDKSQKWYELSDPEKSKILQSIEAYLPESLKEELEAVIQIRWNKHQQNLANQITAPFMVWELHLSSLIPQWNILDINRTKALQSEFWKKREAEEKEMQRLKRMLPELYKLNNTLALQKFLKGFSGFSFSNVQNEWDQAVNAHQITIQNRMNYRIRRMREFGILEGQESWNIRKEIWLDEMLQIEEEVKPYILFVKKAFQAALPVRRSVEFDPYRHSHDGVEFDPMTVQDQDKWMRAEVMKTLRNKVDRGEVEQINTFCLDSSGSMDHERMRNLFKILYLLILGLEDRKSYDAVHFFSTFFSETANFTNDYTNRSLLFKVLRRISTIHEKEVLYGGNGGTNISDGVLKCHERILDFSKGIKEKSPEINIVSSLFVITDGEPSMGIINIEELHDFIETKRIDGSVAIKGIYLKSEEDESGYISQIFGENNYVETTDFNEAVDKFVRIMTQTYKEQRRNFKWKKKLEK